MARRFLLVIGVALVAASVAQAVPKISAGRLTAAPLGTPQCPGQTTAIQGQQVRLTGNGFTPNSSVTLRFRCCEDLLTELGSVNADALGSLDTTITVPSGFTVPEPAGFIANGSAPAANTLRSLTVIILIGPGSAADGDLDGLPDYCDNCPSIGNANQADDDSDSIGNVCDSCPQDFGNDLDADGLCSNVDACPFDANNDSDGDGICGDVDNCPDNSNSLQEDVDSNGIGDACQTAPTCSDGIDNDLDGRQDFPEDPGCSDAADTTETSAAIPCDDGIDNDGDAIIDFRFAWPLTGDPGCPFDTAANPSAPENPQCDDGIDNDLDGFIDWDGKFGLTQPDPECIGFGFFNDEAVVPEPGFLLSLSVGALFLSVVGRYSKRT